MRISQQVANALASKAAMHPKLWILDGDLGDSYGLYEPDGCPRFERFFQAGIAEQAMLGVAAGMAATGQQPWVFSFAAFLCHRGTDQIRTCIAHEQQAVVLVGSHAGASTGSNGASHACLSDIGILSAMGGIDIWAPADRLDVVAAVDSLLERPRPAYIRGSREPVAELPLPAGLWRHNGLQGPVALISTGQASHWAHETVQALAAQGLNVPWSHIPALSEPALEACLDHHGDAHTAWVMEDHGPVGGLADALRSRASPRLQIRSLCWPNGWYSEAGPLDGLRAKYALDTPALVKTITDVLS